jgi:hypothetical protein
MLHRPIETAALVRHWVHQLLGNSVINRYPGLSNCKAGILVRLAMLSEALRCLMLIILLILLFGGADSDRLSSFSGESR